MLLAPLSHACCAHARSPSGQDVAFWKPGSEQRHIRKSCLQAVAAGEQHRDPDDDQFVTILPQVKQRKRRRHAATDGFEGEDEWQGAPAMQHRGQRHLHGSVNRSSSSGGRRPCSISQQPGHNAAGNRSVAAERGTGQPPVQRAAADWGAAAAHATGQQRPQQHAADGWGAARRGGVDAGPLLSSRPLTLGQLHAPRAAVSAATSRPHVRAPMPAAAPGVAGGEEEEWPVPRFERLRSERQQAAAQQRQWQRRRQTGAPLPSGIQPSAAPGWPSGAPLQPQRRPVQQANPLQSCGSSFAPGGQQMPAHNRLHSFASNPLRQLPNGRPSPDRRCGLNKGQVRQQLPSPSRHAPSAAQLHSGMTDGLRGSLQRRSPSAAVPAAARTWGQAAADSLSQDVSSCSWPADTDGNICCVAGQAAGRGGWLRSNGDAPPLMPTAGGNGGLQLGSAAANAELHEPDLAAPAQPPTTPALGAWGTWLDDGEPAGVSAAAAQPHSTVVQGAWAAWLDDGEPTGGSAAVAIAGGIGWPAGDGSDGSGGSASVWAATAGSPLVRRPCDAQLVLDL